MEDPFETIPLRRAQYRLAVMWFVPASWPALVGSARSVLSAAGMKWPRSITGGPAVWAVPATR